EKLQAITRLKAKHLHRFGSYTLDAEERVLFRDGQPVSLPPKDLETLLVLVENAGHIVEKGELIERVWPGVFIEENNLSRRIFNMRQLLGVGSDGRPYIETIPKRGYRFSAPVLNGENQLANSGSITVEVQISPTRTARRNLNLWPVVLSLALAVAGILLGRYFWPPPTASAPKVMLAVLPFENLTNEQDDYFADGLTEEMIAQLGELQPGKLGVIARTSVARYKHTKETAAQIGRELGVNYLLE